MSDTGILVGIVIIFVALGTILPFVHDAFDQQATDINAAGLEFEAGQQSGVTVVLGVIVSITTMFFWTFGNIPFIIDAVIFIPIRIVFLVLLFKLIRGVGG